MLCRRVLVCAPAVVSAVYLISISALTRLTNRNAGTFPAGREVLFVELCRFPSVQPSDCIRCVSWEGIRHRSQCAEPHTTQSGLWFKIQGFRECGFVALPRRGGNKITTAENGNRGKTLVRRSIKCKLAEMASEEEEEGLRHASVQPHLFKRGIVR